MFNPDCHAQKRVIVVVLVRFSVSAVNAHGVYIRWVTIWSISCSIYWLMDGRVGASVSR